ncbi:MAG: hypothetical protein QXI12_12390 [Candidatus Methanomethyliaceae archaeon]
MGRSSGYRGDRLPMLGALAATIEVSQPKQLTTDANHDRNASFFIAQDGTWWLFFARGRTSPAPADPDQECCWPTGGYDIAYLKSTNNGAS